MYKITKGQLATMWLFGLFMGLDLFSIASNSYDGDSGISVVGLLIFGGLIFYSLGWRNFRKK